MADPILAALLDYAAAVHISPEEGLRRRGLATSLLAERAQALRPSAVPIVPELHNADWLRHEYESGKSADRIAVDLGCNPKTVLRYLARHGIDRRQSAPGRGRSIAIRDAGRAEVIAALLCYVAETGQSPSQDDFDRWGMDSEQGVPSSGTVRRRFGTWRKALSAAGLSPKTPIRVASSAAGPRPGRNRQMVTGKGHAGPGAVKHYEAGDRTRIG